MAKKRTINVIVASTDAILGTTYTTKPIAVVIPKQVVNAQKQFKKYDSARKQKIRSENTKKK